MDVTVTPTSVVITKEDGTVLSILLLNIVDAVNVSYPSYVASATDPTQLIRTFNYKVLLHLVDNRVEQIDMGTVGDQPTWTNTLSGGNQAVIDIFGGGTPSTGDFNDDFNDDFNIT